MMCRQDAKTAKNCNRSGGRENQLALSRFTRFSFASFASFAVRL